MAKQEHNKEDLRKAIRAQMRDELKAELQAAESQTHTAQTRTLHPKSTRRWWAAAAAVLLLVIATWSFLKTQTVDNQELFAAHFEPFDNIVVPVERGNADNLSKAQTAFTAYENGNYAEAIAAFESLPDSLAGLPVYQFYGAIARLQIGDGENVTQTLQNLSDSASFQFQKPAAWYLGLAYLQSDNADAARKIFTEIKADTTHPYQKEAAEILEKLK